MDGEGLEAGPGAGQGMTEVGRGALYAQPQSGPLQTLLSLSLHNTGFSWFSFCLARLLLLFFTFSPFSTHPRKPGFLGAQTLSFIKSFFRWFTDPYRFEE